PDSKLPRRRRSLLRLRLQRQRLHLFRFLPIVRGVWGSYGAGSQIPPGLVNNRGIVGIGVTEDWDVIETADGVYNWSSLDAKIAIAKAAGFNYLGLGITWSSFNTPEWLRTELKDAGQTIPLRDPGTIHHTYCEEIDVPFYWSQRWHAKWLALIAAAGAHYTNDPAIVATFASAFDHNSLDWNIQDFVGDLLNCPHFAWHMEHRKQAGTQPFRMPALLGALPCAAGLLAVPGNASSQVPRGVF